MKLDPKVTKELNKSIDGYIRKNGFSMNARDIDRLRKDFDGFIKKYEPSIRSTTFLFKACKL